MSMLQPNPYTSCIAGRLHSWWRMRRKPKTRVSWGRQRWNAEEWMVYESSAMTLDAPGSVPGVRCVIDALFPRHRCSTDERSSSVTQDYDSLVVPGRSEVIRGLSRIGPANVDSRKGARSSLCRTRSSWRRSEDARWKWPEDVTRGTVGRKGGGERRRRTGEIEGNGPRRSQQPILDLFPWTLRNMRASLISSVIADPYYKYRGRIMSDHSCWNPRWFSCFLR